LIGRPRGILIGRPRGKLSGRRVARPQHFSSELKMMLPGIPLPPAGRTVSLK
jgi:hypothetical protein